MPFFDEPPTVTPAKRRKSSFFEEPKPSTPKVEKVCRIHVCTGTWRGISYTYFARSYEDRTSPDQVSPLWYDWRDKSTNRNAQTTNPLKAAQ